MSAQEVPNLLMQEMGGEFLRAHEQAKNVKVEPGNTLPDGVQGVAKLRKIGIQKIAKGKNVGKLMFYADATIQEPEVHNKIKTAGKRTFISEPLHETPTRKRKTFREHLEHVYKWLKMLGLAVEKINPKDLTKAVQSLLNPTNPVFISFRTWKPPKAESGEYAGRDSMMMHFWDERVIGYVPPKKADTAVNVNLGDGIPDTLPDLVMDPDNEATEPTTTPGIDAFGKTSPSSEPPSIQEIATLETITIVSPEDVDKGWDLDSLVKRATQDSDLVAIQHLTEMALKAGLTQQQVDLSPSWQALVDEMRAKDKSNTNGHTDEGEGSAVAIAIGDQFGFRPFDPSLKKKSDKPISVKVVGMSEEKGTVDIQNLANIKIVYKNIPVSELEEVK